MSRHGLKPHGPICVDPDDLHLMQTMKWSRSTQGYAQGKEWLGGINRTIRLHRLIAGAPPEVHVDHANGDILDNRRSNLRFCTRSQNSANAGKSGVARSSQYKGVCYVKRSGKWQAHIKVLGIRHFLGTFRSEVDAARAYDRAAVQHFGEFARPNFPQGQERAA